MKDLTKIFQLNPKLDAVMVLSETNRFYFTEFASTFGVLLLTREKTIFITDPRYYEMAEELKDKGIETRLIEIGKSAYEIAKDVLKELNVKHLGFEDQSVTVSDFDKIKSAFHDFTLIPTSENISKLRSVKTEDEIEYIKKAQSITDIAFSKILGFINENVSEIDIAVELEYQMRKHGASALAFDTIIASGINSSKPHAHPTNKRIKKGDPITMDFGAKFNGYCSDMTRTVFFGEPSEEMRNIYNIVLMAQTNAINNLQAGLTGREIDSLAREIIIANGYGSSFSHSTGHSLGLDIHESPNAAKSSDTVFQENQFITIEPGIYIPGFGGVRIEDLILIKQNEIENLTNSEKTIIIL